MRLGGGSGARRRAPPPGRPSWRCLRSRPGGPGSTDAALDQASSGRRLKPFRVRGPQPTGDVVSSRSTRTFTTSGPTWPLPRSSYHARDDRQAAAAGARQIVYDVQFTERAAPSGAGHALYEAVSAPRRVLATGESDGHGARHVLGGEERSPRAGARQRSPYDEQGVVRRRASSRARPVAVATAQLPAPRRCAAAFDSGGPGSTFAGGRARSRRSPSRTCSRALPAAELRGKVVVVGAGAATLRDVHATPAGGDKLIAASVPANAIWTALRGLPLRAAGTPLGLAILLMMSAFAPLVRMRLPALAVALAAPVAAAVYLVGAQIALNTPGSSSVHPGLRRRCWLRTAATIAWSHILETRGRRAAEVDNKLLEQRPSASARASCTTRRSRLHTDSRLRSSHAIPRRECTSSASDASANGSRWRAA